MVYAVARKHGGYARVEATGPEGTTFTVRLPACESCEPVAVAPRLAGLRSQARVLVMDDDPQVRAVARAILQSRGYDVQVAKDGAEAVAVWRAAREAGTPFDVTVLDLTVPGGMVGTETLAELKALDPEVIAIVSSGYSDAPVMAEFADHGFAGIAAKPYTALDLDNALQSALRERRRSQG